MRHKESKYFDVIATELCRRVGLPFPPPEGTKYEVDTATWTEAEETDFRVWMKAYLKTVPMFKRMGVRYIDKEIMWFVFQHGWKLSDG